MSRYLLIVLMLATVVALADDKPAGPQPAARPADAQAKADAAQLPVEHPQAQTEETKGQAEEAQPQTGEDAKLISVPGGKALGMSILGNQDAPKSLVIVPWKSSELGRSPGIAPLLDDSRQPVDKEVFMRALRYYEIRSETKK